MGGKRVCAHLELGSTRPRLVADDHHGRSDNFLCVGAEKPESKLREVVVLRKISLTQRPNDIGTYAFTCIHNTISPHPPMHTHPTEKMGVVQSSWCLRSGDGEEV